MSTLTYLAPSAADHVQTVRDGLAELGILARYESIDNEGTYGFIRAHADLVRDHIVAAPADETASTWVVTVDEPNPSPNLPPVEHVVPAAQVAETIAQALADEVRARAEEEGRDTWSSASRQHFIDEGAYLWPGEALTDDQADVDPDQQECGTGGWHRWDQGFDGRLACKDCGTNR